MAKEFAEKFYKSQQWKKTRDLYARSVGGLCEVCWQDGKVIPGEIVHHKIFLTQDNINDPSITLNYQNLELVCRDCHARIHNNNQRRYEIDELGRVII